MVVVTGKVNRRAEDGQPEILVEEMVPLAQAREQYVSELMVRTSSSALEEKVLEDLKTILSRYPGRCRVCVEVDTPPQGSVVVETDLNVKPTAELFEEIERRLGHESWRITKIGR
jgi:DNA polymerase III alpha subunit